MKCFLYLCVVLAAALLTGYKPLPASIINKTNVIATPPDTVDTLTVGCAQIIQSRSITALLKKHIAFNQAQKTVDGYRIEIFSGAGTDGKNGAGNARTTFMTRHTDEKAYLNFSQPNYTIRVGDFKDRIEAMRYLQKLKSDFPDAILVKDKVVK